MGVEIDPGVDKSARMESMFCSTRTFCVMFVGDVCCNCSLVPIGENASSIGLIITPLSSILC